MKFFSTKSNKHAGFSLAGVLAFFAGVGMYVSSLFGGGSAGNTAVRQDPQYTQTFDCQTPIGAQLEQEYAQRNGMHEPDFQSMTGSGADQKIHLQHDYIGYCNSHSEQNTIDVQTCGYKLHQQWESAISQIPGMQNWLDAKPTDPPSKNYPKSSYDESFAHASGVVLFLTQQQVKSVPLPAEASLAEQRIMDFTLLIDQGPVNSSQLAQYGCFPGAGSPGTPQPSTHTPPDNLAVTISPFDANIKLTWENNDSYRNIEIDRAIDKDNTDFEPLATVSGATTSYSYDLTDEQLLGDTQSYRIRAVYADGTYSPYARIFSVSNCVDLSATPASNNIIFRREDLVNLTPKYLFQNFHAIIDNNFATVDPYRAYFSNFSFQVDLKQIHDDTLRYSVSNRLSTAAGSIVSSTSSCTSKARVYVSYMDDPLLYYAWTDPVATQYVYMNVDSMMTLNNGTTIPNTHLSENHQGVLHEVTHSIGHINDEYPKGDHDWTDILNLALPPRENCALNPSVAFRSSIDGKMYGSPASVDTQGCGIATTSSVSIYRPSPQSIMNDQFKSEQFNVISCGYLIAGILKQPTDKPHAEVYWPACMNMNTIKDGIPTGQ